MTKLNAASKSVIANLHNAADSVSRASFDNKLITFRRNGYDVIQIYAVGNFAWVRAEVEHPDDGSLYRIDAETETEGLNGAITSLLAKLTHDSLTAWAYWHHKGLLSWMLGMNE